MQVATAILSVLIIWPFSGPRGEEPALWEHQQRFAWTDDKIEEVREARTRDSHGRVPHDVRARLPATVTPCSGLRSRWCWASCLTGPGCRSIATPLPVQEPVFSMQRCATLYLWACFVYQYTEVESLEGVDIGDEILGILDATSDAPQPAFDALMAMFGLTDYKLFWERSADTKALVAWSSTCVVVSFRGTTTVTNAKRDLQVRLPTSRAERRCGVQGGAKLPRVCVQIFRTRVPDLDPDWEHPSGKACVCSGHMPKVHSGFQASYESSSTKSKILMLLLSLLESGTVDVSRVKVYTCGHSLGGALAALCASAHPPPPLRCVQHSACPMARTTSRRCGERCQSVRAPRAVDIARSCKLSRSSVVCYTYGCPRIGNHAYRHLGHELVPETWCAPHLHGPCDHLHGPCAHLHGPCAQSLCPPAWSLCPPERH